MQTPLKIRTGFATILIGGNISSDSAQSESHPGSDYDPLLPIQYYEAVAGGRSLSGEFKLFFAILEDALRCYVRARNCRSKRAEFLDACAWFKARGTPHVFSFESVCAYLDIEPEWLRTRLESLGPSDLPMKQFRTRRRHLQRPAREALSPPAPWRSAQ